MERVLTRDPRNAEAINHVGAVHYAEERVDACEVRPLARVRGHVDAAPVLVEVPERDAVLHRDDDGVVVVQRRELSRAL